MTKIKPITESLLRPKIKRSPKVQSIPKNKIVLVVDKSGSMGIVTHETKAAVESMINEIKEQAKATGQPTDLAIVTFNSHVSVGPLIPAEYQGPLVDYYPTGQTALFDAIGQAVHLLSRSPSDDNTSYLLIGFTDGDDNVCLTYSGAQISELIKARTATGKWTFAFQMPPGTGAMFAQKYSIPQENIREWEATAKGVEEVRKTTNLGTQAFYGTRAAGGQSTTSFYSPDLSAINAKVLDDLSDRFKLYTVEHEAEVKDFVESKTHKPYVVGSAYYQLMKKEKVQTSKSLLIMEKGKKAVWGGADAKALIKFPTKGKEVRVTPGNHANYDIFFESRSFNRLLPRGTKVLIDTTKTKGEEPTWLPVS